MATLNTDVHNLANTGARVTAHFFLIVVVTD